MKILGRMNSRTVMMERFQDAEFSWRCCPQKTVTIPRSVCVLYLLFTQPSLIRSFHSSDPCFSMSCPKGVGYARVYCTRLYMCIDYRVGITSRSADSIYLYSCFCSEKFSYRCFCLFAPLGDYLLLSVIDISPNS